MISLFAGICNGIFGAGGSLMTLGLVEMFLHIGEYQAGSIAMFIFIISTISNIVIRNPYSHFSRGNLSKILYLGSGTIMGSLVGNWLAMFLNDKITAYSIAILELLLAVYIFYDKNGQSEKEPQEIDKLKGMYGLTGLIVGVFGGVSGTGGGYLLIPILRGFYRERMENALYMSVTATFLHSLLTFSLRMHSFFDELGAVSPFYSAFFVVIGVYFGVIIFNKSNKHSIYKAMGYILLFEAIENIIASSI